MGRGNKNRTSRGGIISKKIDYGLHPSSASLTTSSFVERRNLKTENLHTILQTREKPVTVLLGPAGIGKSTLAKKYVKYYRGSYFHLIFIQAQNFESLAKDFEALNNALDFNRKESARKSKTVATTTKSQENSGQISKAVSTIEIHERDSSILDAKKLRRQIVMETVHSFYTRLVGGMHHETHNLPSLIVFENVGKLGRFSTPDGDQDQDGDDTMTENEEEMEDDEDGIFNFLPQKSLKSSFRILVTSRNEGEWDEEICSPVTMEPFSEEETVDLFFETLKFELEQNNKNRRLALRIHKATKGNPLNVQRELRYKGLILKYRTKILKELKEPEAIGMSLRSLKIIEPFQCRQLCTLPVREHKNAALFDMLLRSRAEQIQDIIGCLKQHGGSLWEIFDTIATRVSDDSPWGLHDGASERNVDDLFKLPLKDHVNDETFWIKEGQTPLHLAVVGEDSKKALKFVMELLDRVSTLIVQQEGSTSWLTSTWPTTQAFLDHRDSDGMTAQHLASQHESVEIVKWLYDQRANIVIKNKAGITPLEIMYEKTPSAVAYILDKALPLCEDHSTKGNLEFDVDFLSVLGYVDDDAEVSVPSTTPSRSDVNQTFDPIRSTEQTTKLSTKFCWPISNSCDCCHRVTVENEDEKDKDLELMLVTTTTTATAAGGPDEGAQLLKLKIRKFRNGGNFNENRMPREMLLLANMVLRNFEDSSKIILSHVVVKAFLDLKWTRLRWPIRLWTLFYIVLHFWFTWFIISVFIVSYPHQEYTGPPGDRPIQNVAPKVKTIHFENGQNDKGSVGVWQYLFGVWDTIDHGDANPIGEWSGAHFGQAIAFICFGILLVAIEAYELYLITSLTMRRIGKKSKNSKRDSITNNDEELSSSTSAVGLEKDVLTFSEPVQSKFVPAKGSRGHDDGALMTWFKMFHSCVVVYLSNLENVFQIFFIFLMMAVSTVVFQKSIHDFYYEAAAVSVVVCWTLILLQFGNFYQLGKYVHILKTVLRSFFIVMGVYLALVLAFCISFSILFNKEHLFRTLPTSFFRALAMMGGDINYDAMFEENDEKSTNNPIELSFPFAKQLLHACFTVIVTVVLINLLIGLTVSDIEKIRDRSDVIFRNLQVERLYIMENILIHVLSWFISVDFMYIVPLTGNDMVIRQPVKNLPPRLQREIRLLLAQNEERANQTVAAGTRCRACNQPSSSSYISSRN